MKRKRKSNSFQYFWSLKKEEYGNSIHKHHLMRLTSWDLRFEKEMQSNLSFKKFRWLFSFYLGRTLPSQSTGLFGKDESKERETILSLLRHVTIWLNNRQRNDEETWRVTWWCKERKVFVDLLTNRCQRRIGFCNIPERCCVECNSRLGRRTFVSDRNSGQLQNATKSFKNE